MAEHGRLPVRLAAAKALEPVLRRQRSLDGPLASAGERVAPAERPWLQAACYGVVREAPRLEALAGMLLSRPLRARDADVQALILLGLYQLRAMQVPAHAAVAETVAVAPRLDKRWARGLVNAVLRRYQREADALEAALDRQPAARHRHPTWLIETLQADWPADWETILAANNQPGPMTLRVNLARTSREAYLAELAAHGVAARALAQQAAGIELATPVDITALPGFAEGRVSVQDGAAQLAAELLRVQSGEHVLDACAAPGGKSAHLLERYPAMQLTACDIDADRLERVRLTLARLGLDAAQGRQVTLQAVDAAAAGTFGTQRFDHILLDAPCSGSGVIRRHPDIKLLRRPADIPALAARQRALLQALWPQLAPGGQLLYATCSVLPAENCEVIDAFLAEQADARALSLPETLGRPSGAGRQILPGEQGRDGFFYALLTRQAAG